MGERGGSQEVVKEGEVNAFAMCAANKHTNCGDTDAAHVWKRARVCLKCWMLGWRPVEWDVIHVELTPMPPMTLEYSPPEWKPSISVYTVVLADGSLTDIELVHPNDAQDDAKAEIYRRWGWVGFRGYFLK